MQFYRCKCGKSTSWTTMGVERCVSCSTCGSDLAQGPDSHRAPGPHDFKPQFSRNTGEREADVCVRCMKKRPTDAPQLTGTESEAA